MPIAQRFGEHSTGYKVTKFPNGDVHCVHANPDYLPDFASRKVFTATVKDADVDIPYSKEGPASYKDTSVIEVLDKCVAKWGDQWAVRWEDLSQEGAPLVGWTYAEYNQHIRTTARAFMHLGLERFGSVAIIGFNSKEWFLSQMAAGYAGGSGSGIYTTNGPAAATYVVWHSKSVIVTCEDEKQLAKFLPSNLPKTEINPAEHDLSHVRAFVCWDKSGVISDSMRQKFAAELPNAQLLTWAELAPLAAHVPEADLDARKAAIRPGHCMSLIYTSGTTGNPKGCVISHDNFMFGLRGAYTQMQKCDPQRTEEMVSYLPLSHVAAQMLDILAPIFWSADMDSVFRISFARPDALKGSLKDTLKKVRPTVFFGVPRVWEKFQEAITAIAKANPAGCLKQMVIDWAKNQGVAQNEKLSCPADQSLAGKWDVQTGEGVCFGVAKSIVFSKIYEALGLDRAYTHCFSAGAPIQVQTLEFFAKLGFTIHEIWGMSEHLGIGAIGYKGARRIGWCGPPVFGSEVKISHDPSRGDPKGQGELCIRGRQVMLGYLNDEQKTRETIDADGWLHSGDLATIDDYGLVRITGRIKELIITAGGENVAPVPIEDWLKLRNEAISNCIMVGDKKKYNTLLVTLKTRTAFESDEVSRELVKPALGLNGSTATTTVEAMTCPKIREAITETITQFNKVAAVSNAQRIQKFEIIPDDFTMKNGDVTASLKLRRNIILAKYDDVIKRMYGDDDE